MVAGWRRYDIRYIFYTGGVSHHESATHATLELAETVGFVFIWKTWQSAYETSVNKIH